jgi:hypothetical protein
MLHKFRACNWPSFFHNYFRHYVTSKNNRNATALFLQDDYRSKNSNSLSSFFLFFYTVSWNDSWYHMLSIQKCFCDRCTFLPALFSALIPAARVINKNSVFFMNGRLLWCHASISRCNTNPSHYIHAVFMFKHK